MARASHPQPKPAHRIPGNVGSFITLHLADAKHVSQLSSVPVSVILAQSGFESGWGLHVVDNAYFGIKGHAPNGNSTRFVTHEVSHGVAHRITDTFRSYASYVDAANDYANVLHRRFAAAFAHGDDSLQFVTYLRGYATNPNYVATLQAIIRDYDLKRYDRKP
jgi:flagellum-specific peptidoglycan hydrolase FlgJ